MKYFRKLQVGIDDCDTQIEPTVKMSETLSPLGSKDLGIKEKYQVPDYDNNLRLLRIIGDLRIDIV